MRQFSDQCGFTITITNPPLRIVSIVPSQTELLYHLGVDVAGITRFCIHPAEWFRTKPRVGGTKQVDINRVAKLNPQLILANREENVQEQVNALRQLAPVWTSDISNLATALDMILQVGSITGTDQHAKELADNIRLRFAAMQRPTHPLRVAYLIWREPYMTVGHDTFIHALLQEAGMQNVFADKTRYPVITIDDLKHAQPDCLLLSSEPFPFANKHITELRRQGINYPAYLVDGELFSWYGSRLLHSPAYFEMLNQQIRAGK